MSSATYRALLRALGAAAFFLTAAADRFGQSRVLSPVLLDDSFSCAVMGAVRD